jgi:outer membrane lipoprotein-sorting protein
MIRKSVVMAESMLTMVRAFTLAAAPALVLAAAPVAAAPGDAGAGTQASDPAEVIRRVQRMDTAPDEQAQFTMRLIESSGRVYERTGTLYEKQVSPGAVDEMHLIRFHTPADIQGSGVLTIENPDRDNDQWLYLPAYHTTRRVAPANRGDRYMGTDFLYEDIMRERVEQYTYRAAGSETLDGVPCVIIEATPADERLARESAYSKKRIWVDTARDLVLRVHYFNKEGRLFKEMTVTATEKVGDRFRWRTIRMQDHDRQHETTLEYRDRKIGAGVPKSYFTEAYLKRGQ